MAEIGVGLVGYKFMGRAHSNGYRQVAHFFDVDPDAADGRDLRAGRGGGQGGGRAARLGGVRDRLPEARRPRRHRAGRRLDDRQHPLRDRDGGAGGTASTSSARSRWPTLSARREEMLEAAEAAGRASYDDQLQLPPRAGGRLRPAADRRGQDRRDPPLAGGLPPGLDQRSRSSRSSGGCRRSWPGPARSATSPPTSSTSPTSSSGRSPRSSARSTPSSRSGRSRRRAAGGAGLDRRPAARDGRGHGRRLGLLPGPLRERRHRHLRGDAAGARAGATTTRSRSTARTAVIIFNLERMNELQVYFADDPAGLQGFRTINVTDGGPPLRRRLVAGRPHHRLRAHLHPRRQGPARRHQGRRQPRPDLRGRLPLPGRPRRRRAQQPEPHLGDAEAGEQRRSQASGVRKANDELASRLTGWRVALSARRAATIRSEGGQRSAPTRQRRDNQHDDSGVASIEAFQDRPERLDPGQRVRGQHDLEVRDAFAPERRARRPLAAPGCPINGSADPPERGRSSRSSIRIAAVR